MIKIQDRIGEIHYNRRGEKFTLVDATCYQNCTLEFEDGTRVYKKEYSEVLRKTIKNPFTPIIFGVGYFGVGKYKAKTPDGKVTKSYSAWKNMLARCYDEKTQLRTPSYKGTIVCVKWHNFQNFAKWFENNYINSYQLDKDLLFKNKKIYSPKTCCFVPREINNLLLKQNSNSRKYPIGVYFNKGKFESRLYKEGKSYHLGTFNTSEEAFYVYKTAKESYVKEVANKWRNSIDIRIYKKLMNFKVSKNENT